MNYWENKKRKMSGAQKCQHDMQQHGPQQLKLQQQWGKICNWWGEGG